MVPVQTLQVKPGDLLVLRTEHSLTKEQTEDLSQRFANKVESLGIANVKTMVLTDGSTLLHVQPE